MDKSVDDSILEVTVLHLFAEDETTNQEVKVVPVLAFFVVSILFYRLLGAYNSTGVYPLYVEVDDRRGIIREGHAALSALFPFFFRSRREEFGALGKQYLVHFIFYLLLSHSEYSDSALVASRVSV
jgi:hypothetical protein